MFRQRLSSQGKRCQGKRGARFWPFSLPKRENELAGLGGVEGGVETGNKNLFGQVACELSSHLYGEDKWWVMLERVVQ